LRQGNTSYEVFNKSPENIEYIVLSYEQKGELTIMKYRITKGIFEGRIFSGEIIRDRVWDNDSFGRSYPIENCEVVEDE